MEGAIIGIIITALGFNFVPFAGKRFSFRDLHSSYVSSMSP